jgi:hypothetical protein
VVRWVVMLLYRFHTLLPQLVVRRVAMLLHHICTLHLRHIHTLSSQHVHSGGADNSGGWKNTSHTTQALTMMKKRNEWTRDDGENLVLLNFIISLSFI